MTYSYDSLTVFRTTEGDLGWVHRTSPATRGYGAESFMSHPEGLTEAPDGSTQTSYRHHAGCAAGDRRWSHQHSSIIWTDGEETVAEANLLAEILRSARG
jgi:hypothetical protein